MGSDERQQFLVFNNGVHVQSSEAGTDVGPGMMF